MPPSTASYADAIRFSADENRRLCRGVVNGNTYLGAEEDQICQVNIDGTAVKLESFQFAVGLAHWEASSSRLNIPQGLIAGQQGANLLFACRVEDGNSHGAGWGIEIDNIRTCHYVFRGNARSSKDMEYLFPIEANESVQVTLANNQCLTITPPGNEGSVATQSTCNQTTRQVWNLQLRGGSNAALSSAAFAGCLAPKGDGSLTLTPCSAPASNLRVSWVNDTQLTIRATSTGEFLEINNGSVDQDIALKASTGPTTPWRRTTIRSLGDAARRLKLLTYNTMMFGKIVQPFAQNELRMTFILDALRQEAEQPDVIVLAEIFDEFIRPFLRGRLSAMGYRHWATSPLSAISIIQPSGMWIQSKWPIEESAHILFSESSGSDSFSLKGVVYARINKMGRRYHVFGTHLQSGFEQSAVRVAQLNQMANFVASRTTVGSDEPVILAGDFNIDMEGQVADYNLMLALLNAQFVSPPRPVGVPANPAAVPFRYTVNPTVNQIAGARGAERKEWLDYAFNSRRGPLPYRARHRAFDYRSPGIYPANFWDTGRILLWRLNPANLLEENVPFFTYTDLSDHSALWSYFEFPYAPLLPVLNNPSRIRILPLNQEANPIEGTRVRVNSEISNLPLDLSLPAGQLVDLEGLDAEPVNGERWAFSSWADGRPRAWQLQTPSTDQDYKVVFRKQFQLSVSANPPVGGQVTEGGFFDLNQQATVAATPAPGFRFTGFTGSINSTSPTMEFPVTQPVALVANFESVGQPVLNVSVLERSTPLSGYRRLRLALGNTGQNPASNARITGISNVQVISGSGAVSVFSTLPLHVGAVLPNGTAEGLVDFLWPDTARRVRFTVTMEADHGYRQTQTLTMFR